MLFTAEIKVLNGNYFVGQCEKDGVPKSSTSEGPAGWATSFEKLLEDPLGLHTFAVSLQVFLKLAVKFPITHSVLSASNLRI